MFLFIILAFFSIRMLWMVSHIFCLVAWYQVFISGKLIHAFYIHWCSIVEVVVGMLCAPKSVAVTWLCAHCFDKNFVFSVSRYLSLFAAAH